MRDWPRKTLSLYSHNTPAWEYSPRKGIADLEPPLNQHSDRGSRAKTRAKESTVDSRPCTLPRALPSLSIREHHGTPHRTNSAPPQDGPNLKCPAGKPCR